MTPSTIQAGDTDTIHHTMIPIIMIDSTTLHTTSHPIMDADIGHGITENAHEEIKEASKFKEEQKVL